MKEKLIKACKDYISGKISDGVFLALLNDTLIVNSTKSERVRIAYSLLDEFDGVQND
jgi:hypothetical protein